MKIKYVLILSVIGLVALGVMPASADGPGNYAQVSLDIPSLGVSSSLFFMDIRVNANQGGYWHIGPYESRVGHLQGTPWLGEGGNTVLAGHALYPNGVPGVFNRLDELSPGDLIIVREGRQHYYYTVSYMQVILATDTRVVYEPGHRLTLITCSGDYDPRTRDYEERVVIIAEPVPIFY